MADPVRVFVSHHHSPEEDAFTARLVADLKAAGADVWVDDEGITSDDFVRRIGEGLAGRQWLVLVMTPASVKSPWVQREVGAALNEVTAKRMQGVIPFVMEHTPEQDIPILWRPLHRYDATQGGEPARDNLFRTLGLFGAFTDSTDSTVPPTNVLLDAIAPLGFALATSNRRSAIVPPICHIPAGPFLMGSRWDGNALDREKPRHRVDLPEFEITKYPVTVAEYAIAVVERAIRQPPTSERISWELQLEQLDHPVVCISWGDAVAYASWLSKKTGATWSLPTEAQWEKAARGTKGAIYPWGSKWDNARANTNDGGPGTTTPVARYQTMGASPYGVVDMAGNVFEWCSSAYKPYPYRANDGREQADQQQERVTRGGSFFREPTFARSAFRVYFPQHEFTPSRGFRLTRSKDTLYHLASVGLLSSG